MIEIGNQYDGTKKKYFFKPLDNCLLQSFKELSTENGRLTIYGVREAESMIQSELKGFHEFDSLRRMTQAESIAKNKLDGCFGLGL